VEQEEAKEAPGGRLDTFDLVVLVIDGKTFIKVSSERW
jgi:hypothetical protein